MPSIDYIVTMTDSHDRMDILLLWKDQTLTPDAAISSLKAINGMGEITMSSTYVTSDPLLGYRYAVLTLDEVQSRLAKENLSRLYSRSELKNMPFLDGKVGRSILRNAGSLIVMGNGNEKTAHKYLEDYLTVKPQIPAYTQVTIPVK